MKRKEGREREEERKKGGKKEMTKKGGKNTWMVKSHNNFSKRNNKKKKRIGRVAGNENKTCKNSCKIKSTFGEGKGGEQQSDKEEKRDGVKERRAKKYRKKPS